jgi:hypothetical protein
MIDQIEIDDKKKDRKKSRGIVGGMLTIYVICCILFVVGAFLSYKDDKETHQTNATATEAVIFTQSAISTATEAAIVTQQANATASARPTSTPNATATIISHATEQGSYDLVDRFNGNFYRWEEGSHDNNYWTGERYVVDGVYQWYVMDVKQGFIDWSNVPQGRNIKDFDAYVDFEIPTRTSSGVCAGIMFRVSPEGWYYGGYAFIVCNSGYYTISYQRDNRWHSISDWNRSPIIQPTDWNRIEVSARDTQFKFAINNVIVFEATDKRRNVGDIALLVQVTDLNPAQILFDNFGLQKR